MATNPFDTGLDEVFRALDETGRTMRSLAQAAGISAKHLSEIRHYRTDVTLSVMRKLWDEMFPSPLP